MNGPEVLEMLAEGNRRFAEGAPHCYDVASARKSSIGQHAPLAVVVSCSDARVPAETVFDAPLGSLFSVRSAGHVLGPAARVSVRFAVEKLGAAAVVVLGHEHCGAVEATIAGADAAWLEPLVAPIRAARDEARAEGLADDIEVVTRMHAQATAHLLRRDLAALPRPPLVAAAVYHLTTGQVEWLSDDSPSATGDAST